MLDECKGDKFEEVIRVFAMAVLRKEARQKIQSGGETPTGYINALTAEENLTARQRERTMPLLLAHAHVLRGQLVERRRISGKFHHEEQRLNDARTKLAEKRKAIISREPKVPIITPRELEAVSDHVRTVWTGNERWADVLVHGGPEEIDRFMPEEHLRGGPQQLSSAPEVGLPSPPAPGLLAELNEKIQRQQSRLQKWKDFHASLERSHSDKKVATVIQTRRPMLDFGAHQELQPGWVQSAPTASPGKLSQAHLDCSEIIGAMRTELASLRRAHLPQSTSYTRGSGCYAPGDVEPEHGSDGKGDASKLSPQIISSLYDMADDDDNAARNHLGSAVVGGRDRQDRQNYKGDVLHPSIHKPSKALRGINPIAIPDPHLALKSSPPLSPIPYQDSLRSSDPTLLKAINAEGLEWSTSRTLPVSRNKGQQVASSPSSSEGRPASASNSTKPLLDAQIPRDPSPSPLKPQASTLLERTRLSMAALPSSSHSGPVRPTPNTTRTQTGGLRARNPKHGCPSASASSSGISAANQHQTPRRKQDPFSSSKHRDHPLGSSLTARNDGARDGQPDRSSAAAAAAAENDPGSGSSTPRDRLFGQQADYESVFRSRPKVAVSPPFGSPERAARNGDRPVHGLGVEE